MKSLFVCVVEKCHLMKSVKHVTFGWLAVVAAIGSASASQDVTADLEFVAKPSRGVYSGSSKLAWGCRELYAHRGKLFVGSGESSDNSGMKNGSGVPAIALDPYSGSYVLEEQLGTEEIHDFKELSDGRLYVPAEDPCNGPYSGTLFVRNFDGTWERMSGNIDNQDLYIHGWALDEFDGYVHFAGYSIASSSDYGKKFVVTEMTNGAAYVSTRRSSGVSGKGSVLNRHKGFIKAGNDVYGFCTQYFKVGADNDKSGASVKPFYWHWNPTTASFDKEETTFARLFPSLTASDAALSGTSSGTWVDLEAVKTASFNGRGLYICSEVVYPDYAQSGSTSTTRISPWAGYSAITATDGKLTATRIDFGENSRPFDFTVRNGRVFAVCCSPCDSTHVWNKVFASTDGLNFTELFSFKTRVAAQTVEYFDGAFYFGLSDFDKLDFQNGFVHPAADEESTEGFIYRYVYPLESVQVVANTSDLALAEGATGSVSFRLAAAPTESVTVAVKTTGDANLAASPATLTFTPSDWDVPQSVTVSAVQDGVVLSGAGAVVCGADGVASGFARVAVADDDQAPAFSVSEAVTVTEDTATFEVSVTSLGLTDGEAATSGTLTVMVPPDSVRLIDGTPWTVSATAVCAVPGTGNLSVTVTGLRSGRTYASPVFRLKNAGGAVKQVSMNSKFTFTTAGEPSTTATAIPDGLADLTSPSGTSWNSNGYYAKGDLFSDSKMSYKTRVGFGRNFWIVYDFEVRTLVNAYAIHPYSSGLDYAPGHWEFYGADEPDGPWTVLDVRSYDFDWTEDTIEHGGFYAFENTTKYRYYKLQITGSCGSASMQIGRLQYFNTLPPDPSVTSVVAKDIDSTVATIEVSGHDLNGGTVTVTLVDSNGVTKASWEGNDFGGHRFTDLEPSAAYTATAVAVNSVGTSDPVSCTFKTLPPDVPPSAAASVKGVYDSTTTTLTLYYDESDHAGEGVVYAVTATSAEWISTADKNPATKVVFDRSMKYFCPTSLKNWFYNFASLTALEGLAYLDTSSVTDMSGLFAYCSALKTIDVSRFNTANVTNMEKTFYYVGCTELDLSSFDTSKVTKMGSMFGYSGSLKTVLVSEKFTTVSVTSSGKMFTGAKNVVGGKETVYDANVVDKTYARIDGGTANPGYFTYKAAPQEDDPEEPVVEHTHEWGNWVTNTPPTATTAGQRYRECVAEGCTNPPERQVETIPATGGGEDPDPQEDDPVVPYPADPEDPDADLPEDAELAARAVRIGDTIRFYYDKKSHTREGSTVSEIQVDGKRTWLAPNADNDEITTVIFYSSFKAFKPQSMLSWFHYYHALKNVVGLHNIDTSEVTSMTSLFRCKSSNNGNITELDLSAWDTRNCIHMDYMFARLSGLKTIYVGDNFVVTQVTSSPDMFDRCGALVGGAGTKYNSAHVDKEYAHVDGGTANPGYFTYKAASQEDDPEEPPEEEEDPDPQEDDPVVPPAGPTTITLTAPADGSTYDTHLQALKKYLANSDARSEFPDDDLIAARDTDGNHYVHNAWFTNLLVEAAVEQDSYKPFTWEKTGDITDIVVQYSEDADFTDGLVLNEKYCRDNEASTRPLNLKLATKYWWRVKAKDANGGEVVSDVRTFTTKGDAPRIIGTLGFNMRDLGGGTNAEGLVVRQGLILRGKCPMARVNAEAGWNDQKMTEQSYREFYLDKHHLKTELDFRSAEEALEHQTQYDEIDLATIGIDHLNYEIIPYHLGHPDTDGGIVQSVKMLAEGTHYPVYFNCAVGSDRTGTFGVIIDGIIGRDDQWFYDNYELPSFDSGLARLRYNRKGGEMFEFLKQHNQGEHFRDRVVQYLLARGVTREEIRAVREALLELPPEGDQRELKVASAVYQESTQKLTFYYDEIDHSGDGKTVYITTDGSRSWGSGPESNAVEVVFDESFAGFHPTTCLQWFQNFGSLTSVSGIANLKTDQVTSMGNMFRGCVKLASLDFTGFDTSKVTGMQSMFNSCKALTSLDLSSFVTTNLTTMGMMFYDCSKLVTITVGPGFTVENVSGSGGDNVFRKASKLVGAKGTQCDGTNNIGVEYARVDNPPDAPGYFTLAGDDPEDPPVIEHTHEWGPWVTNKVATATTAGERYRDCIAEGCLNPPERQVETIPATGGSEDPDPQGDDPVVPYPGPNAKAKVVYDANTTTLTFYYDENTYSGEGITQYVMNSSKDPAWTNCSATVTKAVITDAFRYYQPASVLRWFYNMKQLTSIAGLTNLDTSNLTSLRRMFQGSNKLTELDLSSFDTSKVADTRDMFAGCTALTTILVSERWTDAGMNNGENMFNGCNNLVGGAGTAYVAGQAGPEYAHVDGGPDNPGYLTLKSAGPILVKPELGSATMVAGDGKSFGISISNPVVGAAYTVFTSAALDGDFVAEADSTVYASGELVLEFAIEDDKPQKFAKIVISTTPYQQGDPLPAE